MKVVLDTVVLLRALLNPYGPAGRVISRAHEYVAVTSPALRMEFLGILERPALQTRMRSTGPARQKVWRLLASAELVEPEGIDPICRDPDDDKLFACAAAAGADYIVSDDNDVLAIADYEGTRTISTVDFERLLDAQAPK